MDIDVNSTLGAALAGCMVAVGYFLSSRQALGKADVYAGKIVGHSRATDFSVFPHFSCRCLAIQITRN